jgi:hypothetical protein
MDYVNVKRLLMDMGIISIEDDFYSVIENKPLMTGLKMLIINHSSQTVDGSINPHRFTKSKRLHPSKYVSDFDLLVRLETKEHLETFNNERAKENPESRLTDKELHHYWVNVRRTLRKEFIEMRNTMVYNFQMDGSYDLNEKISKRKTI